MILLLYFFYLHHISSVSSSMSCFFICSMISKIWVKFARLDYNFHFDNFLSIVGYPLKPVSISLHIFLSFSSSFFCISSSRNSFPSSNVCWVPLIFCAIFCNWASSYSICDYDIFFLQKLFSIFRYLLLWTLFPLIFHHQAFSCGSINYSNPLRI